MLPKTVYEILGFAARSGPRARADFAVKTSRLREYRQELLIAITPFGQRNRVVSRTYFRNLKGPGLGPLGGSEGGPFSPDVDVPCFVVSAFTRLGATVLTGGGAGLLKVITLPLGLPPFGIAPSLNGPSGGDSALVGVGLLVGTAVFLSD